MDSEEVMFVGVETSTECLYLGRRKRLAKGKSSANPRKRNKSTKTYERCLVVLDSDSDSENGCVEVCEEKIESNGLLPVSITDGDCVVSSPKKGKLSSCEGDVPHSSSSTYSASETPRHDTNLNFLHKDSLLDKTTTNPSTSVPPFSTLPSKEVYSTNHLEPSEKEGSVAPSVHQSDCVSRNSSSWTNQNNDNVTDSVADTGKNSKEDTSSSLESQLGIYLGARRERVPTCWTNCPNCPPSKKRKYHLIDVAYDSAEWGVVSNRLTQSGFTVNRVQRIQNELLWQRLCYEKQLMLREQPDVNEQFLYHTTRSSIPVICEEGLDLRLSRNGCFGHGIYFSDNPQKCNCYWSGGTATPRYMFCCRVLLGEVKRYPKGKSEHLKREPAKINPKPGEQKFYDSVMGNLSGENEFVVYNAYRVMPEYVIQYSAFCPNPSPATVTRPINGFTPVGMKVHFGSLSKFLYTPYPYPAPLN